MLIFRMLSTAVVNALRAQGCHAELILTSATLFHLQTIWREASSVLERAARMRGAIALATNDALPAAGSDQHNNNNFDDNPIGSQVPMSYEVLYS